MNTVASFEAERQAMVEAQLRPRGIRSERVIEAMARVPRHEFVPPAQVSAAYEDRALPIGDWETISQPYMVALMTEAAAVRPGDRVLEVGTGTGYQAAVLAYLGARVYTIERNPQLAEAARQRMSRLGYSGARYRHRQTWPSSCAVEVITGDGSEGYPAAAPYDAILVTAGAPRVSQALLDQLADGGRLIAPIGSRQEQQLQLVVKAGDRTFTQSLTPCQFVPLVGREAWPEARA